MKIMILLVFVLLSSASAKVTELNVIGEIKEDKDISAVSCIKNKFCLLASDETNFLQAFKVVGSNLEIYGKEIELGKFKKENDIEALTNDGVYFYAIGSHGLSRKSGKYQNSRYKLFKILLNNRAELVDISYLPLASILANHEDLGKYFKKSLQSNGINIEGLAYNGGKLYLGFRAPLVMGNAQVLSIKINDFSLSGSKLHSVNLNGQGIRSLEFFNDDLYGITGASLPSDSQTASLAIIDLENDKVFYESVPGDNLKVEGLEVLSNDELFFVYDSEENGKPIIEKRK